MHLLNEAILSDRDIHENPSPHSGLPEGVRIVPSDALGQLLGVAQPGEYVHPRHLTKHGGGERMGGFRR